MPHEQDHTREDWERDPVPEVVDTMPDKRRRQLERQYVAAIQGKTRQERQHEWRRYLTLRFKEGGNQQILMDLRQKPRVVGMALCRQLAREKITRRQYFNRTQARCADLYASYLDTYGLAEIDLDSRRYRDLAENVVLEGLHALWDIDSYDKTVFCRATSKMWHRFVETLHAEYGLPSVAGMRYLLREESKAEQFTLRGGDFETRMTSEEKDDWKRQVGLETLMRRLP